MKLTENNFKDIQIEVMDMYENSETKSDNGTPDDFYNNLMLDNITSRVVEDISKAIILSILKGNMDNLDKNDMKKDLLKEFEDEYMYYEEEDLDEFKSTMNLDLENAFGRYEPALEKYIKSIIFDIIEENKEEFIKE